MTSEQEFHKVGDHRLVGVPTALTSVTFNIASSSTSSSDTETQKYFDQFARSAIQFNMVADGDTQVTAINGTTLTDPITVDANAIYGEDKGEFKSITVKTLAANINISMRVR